jgi:hypothetical protein
MNSLCAQLVVVATSFVLVLPTGWCSGLMQHSQSLPAPTKAICCHHDRSCDPQEVPAKAAIECCCSWQATVPQKSAPQADASSGLALPLVVDLTPDLSGLAAESIIHPFHSGPRLHVLQCVWRC